MPISKAIRFSVIVCITTTVAICFAAIAKSQTVDTWQVLRGNPRCDHVIAQIRRHGVNQSVDNSIAASTVAATPFGFASVPATDLGDLQIVSVHRRVDEAEICGPRFMITVMNQSQHKVDGVDVSVVALLGAIHPHCPSATVRTCAIEPCTAVEVEVVLPNEALSMGNRNGTMIEFQSLVVVIDCHDEWIETNEANNVQAIAASAVPFVSETVKQTIQPAAELELAPNSPTPQTDTPAPLSPNDSLPTETDSVNVDALRNAMDKLNAQSTEVAVTSR
ncbi:hypothetical protein [Rubripirellula reticaptiva]|uniref:CARDB domain-containing protein n=1 Tax=Rubripirellula reticaptiva TaxID=2528013 RepID=A0A5C6ESK5_9BACT|nr:hypothetical protein [Rubripirellula reticaptiva]TWU51625.1 hypothetical protein Poly59_32190 [Rubripirellula reticaptiva]